MKLGHLAAIAGASLLAAGANAATVTATYRGFITNFSDPSHVLFDPGGPSVLFTAVFTVDDTVPGATIGAFADYTEAHGQGSSNPVTVALTIGDRVFHLGDSHGHALHSDAGPNDAAIHMAADAKDTEAAAS